MPSDLPSNNNPRRDSDARSLTSSAASASGGAPTNAASAHNRALELAQYVSDIQLQIEDVGKANKRLRHQLLNNLNHRYAKLFSTCDRVSVMAIFSQWKVVAANSSFKKELVESEATWREEKAGRDFGLVVLLQGACRSRRVGVFPDVVTARKGGQS